MFHFTVRADLSNQPLGENPQNTGCNETGIYVKIQQTCDRADGVIGMLSTQNQMSGLSGSESHLCCFSIPDLPNHNDLGVLP